MERERSRGTWKFWVSLIGLCILVAALGLTMFFLLSRWLPPDQIESYAVGAAVMSAVFSGLAFVGVIAALSVQRADLQLQRNELAATREEFVAQNRTLSLQRFETSFFNLLSAHRELASNLEARFAGPRSDTFRGLHAFQQAATEALSLLEVDIQPEPKGQELTDFLDFQFNSVCRQPEAEFGHYFRSLYHLLKFVRDAEVEDRWPYCQLVRAQLSRGELILLFVFGLTSDGRSMKDFIERYHLLRGVRLSPRSDKYRPLYREAAFGETSRTTLEEPPEPSA